MAGDECCSARLLVSNPAREGAFVRFLELSAIEQVCEDGIRDDNATASAQTSGCYWRKRRRVPLVEKFILFFISLIFSVHFLWGTRTTRFGYCALWWVEDVICFGSLAAGRSVVFAFSFVSSETSR